MVSLTRQQGLKLQGCFRSNTTDYVVVEVSPLNPGNIQVTVWETNAKHYQFEVDDRGRRVNV